MEQLSNLQIFIICACVYIIAACLFFRAIARARPLQTVDGRTEAGTDDTPPPVERSIAGRCRLVDVDSPPVTLKLPPPHSDGDYLVTCKRVLLITGCTDSSMWYSRMIGKEVPYLGEWKVDGCFKSREPAGYINIVWFKDARVIIKEAGK